MFLLTRLQSFDRFDHFAKVAFPGVFLCQAFGRQRILAAQLLIIGQAACIQPVFLNCLFHGTARLCQMLTILKLAVPGQLLHVVEYFLQRLLNIRHAQLPHAGYINEQPSAGQGVQFTMGGGVPPLLVLLPNPPRCRDRTAGQCVEQPGEPEGSRMHENIKTVSYPVVEKNGIVFAYMGPLGENEAPPDFPDYDCFRAPDSHVFAFKGLWECNWLQAMEVGHLGVTELFVVDSMPARKAMMVYLSDAYIALPGGFGTLEEITEVTTLRILGYHHKPLGLLNAHGYFDHLLAFLDHAAQVGFVRPAQQHLLEVDATIEGLLDRLAVASPSL